MIHYQLCRKQSAIGLTNDLKFLMMHHASSIQNGCMETFCPLGHILAWRYWNILRIKIVYFVTKVFNSIYHKIVVQKYTSRNKMFQHPHFAYYQNIFQNSSLSIESISFFSSSGTHQSHHLFGCHATGINSSFNFFKGFVLFKFSMPS